MWRPPIIILETYKNGWNCWYFRISENLKSWKKFRFLKISEFLKSWNVKKVQLVSEFFWFFFRLGGPQIFQKSRFFLFVFVPVCPSFVRTSSIWQENKFCLEQENKFYLEQENKFCLEQENKFYLEQENKFCLEQENKFYLGNRFCFRSCSERKNAFWKSR